MSAFSYEKVDSIINELGAKPSSIIAILQGVQEEYRYLPPEIFPYLAKRLKVSEARVYGTATFYENFSLDPKGEYVIKVCDGTACHVRKSAPILQKLRDDLGLAGTKITTDDLGFTVQTVSCLGACGLAPALTVNDKVYASMTPEKAEALLNDLKAKRAAQGGAQ
jgi:NADH-quinone oxidoreductase subunit E